jgi:Spy/CpxP family protein refolding chaperone
VAASLAMTAGAAMAQPPGLTRVFLGGEAQPPGIANIVQGDGRRERELGVSEEVAGKLATVRDEYKAAIQKECQDAGIVPQDDLNKLTRADFNTYMEIRRKVNNEFNPKAAALLSPDQLRRLQQLDIQAQWRSLAPDTLLRPDVAGELKLVNDQMQALRELSKEQRAKRAYSGTEYTDKALGVLTDEQKEKFNKLKGEEPGRRPAPPGGSAPAQRTTVPPLFLIRGRSVELVRFAALEAVQKDLGVSDEVARKLTLLRDAYQATYQKEYQNADLPQTTPVRLTPELNKKIGEIGQKLDDEYIPKVNELLSADQQKRFQQIRFQNGLRNQGPAALLSVASELKLTDDQQQKLNALKQENSLKQTPPLDFAARREFGERLVKVKEEYTTKAVEVLTAEQKATLQTLKGREFDTSQLVVRGATQGKGN